MAGADVSRHCGGAGGRTKCQQKISSLTKSAPVHTPAAKKGRDQNRPYDPTAIARECVRKVTPRNILEFPEITGAAREMLCSSLFLSKSSFRIIGWPHANHCDAGRCCGWISSWNSFRRSHA